MQPHKKDPTSNPASLVVSHDVPDKNMSKDRFKPACYPGRVTTMLYFLSLSILPFFDFCITILGTFQSFCVWHGWEAQPGLKLFHPKNRQQV